MKKTKYLLALLAAGAVLSAGIGQAMAYFTTYAQAEGGFTVRLGDETNIREDFDDWKKILTIKNEEGSEPVFVRARAFYAPDSLSLSYDGTGWSREPDKDGYVYYSEPVPGGKTAEPLKVSISKIPEDIAKGDIFNVVVIYESTPALYDEEGNPNPDWNSELIVTGRTESSAKPGNQEGGSE